jgi:hypothetical protein
MDYHPPRARRRVARDGYKAETITQPAVKLTLRLRLCESTTAQALLIRAHIASGG